MSSTWKWLSIPLVVLLVATAFWWLRPRHQEISERGYEITLALYSACNARSESRIDQIKALVDDSLSQDQIATEEAAWIERVVETARAGNWREATQQSRAILFAQVEGA